MSKNDLVEAPPVYTFYQHACITLNMSDRLRLIRFPQGIIDIVRQIIITSWPKGLNKEKQNIDFYEFKLNGNPWWGQGTEAVSSRSLITHVLSALHNHGWYLLTSTDVSKKQLDKDTLIFLLGIPPLRTEFFAVSFNDYNKLRLINAPSELISAVQQTLGSANIQKEDWRDGGAAYQFKLHGVPWMAHGKAAITSRFILLSLLDCFSRFGWKLHASIDISQGHEGYYHSAYEFKLNGNPWWSQGFEGISARILMVHVLSALYNHGWYLLASTDLSKKQLDKDALFFQHGILPSQTSFFAISFNEFDKLRLIGTPSELIPAIRQCLNRNDIQREEWLYGGVAYQFKLRGNPWMAGKEEGIYSRIKLLSILDCLTTFGWKLYASIDMSKGQEGRHTDTWFFRRDIQ